MADIQTANARAARGHVFKSPHSDQSFPHASASVETSMSVFFEEGRFALPEREIETLAQWIHSWNTTGSKQHLHIGGAYETSRTNRLRRLGFMMTLLQQLGVPQKRLHPEDDWTTSIRMGSMDDVPVDEVWLKLREFQSS